MNIERRDRRIGDYGRCEAEDWVPTNDDAVSVRCPRQGRIIRERHSDGSGHFRLRCVCPVHGLTSVCELN